MNKLTAMLLLIVAPSLGACGSTPATPTTSPPPAAWPIPTISACTVPFVRPNGHRLHIVTTDCVGPWRTTRRPHVALTVPLWSGVEPPGLMGSAALLVTVAADAPDPSRPDTRASFRATALHDGFELVPIARPDRVGWRVHLPAAATESDVTRAVDLLLRLAATPTFGAALVATTAERFTAATTNADQGHTLATLGAWALALADGHANPAGGPPDSRTLAVVNREDLARLHRRVFSEAASDLVVAGAPANHTTLETLLDTLTSKHAAATSGTCRLATRPRSAALRSPHPDTVITARLGQPDDALVARIADLIELLPVADSERPMLAALTDSQIVLLASETALGALVDLARSHASLLAARHAPITTTAPSNPQTLAEILASLPFEPTTVVVHGFTDAPPPGAVLVTDLRCQMAP